MMHTRLTHRINIQEKKSMLRVCSPEVRRDFMPESTANRLQARYFLMGITGHQTGGEWTMVCCQW